MIASTTNSLVDITYEEVVPGYERFDYHGFKLIIERSTGYVNATHLCKQSEKKRLFSDWIRQSTAKEIIESVSASVAIPAGALTRVVHRDAPNEIRGTYVHRDLVPAIKEWATSNMTNSQYENMATTRFIKMLDLDVVSSIATEVKTGITMRRKIDILTSTTIYEVKIWKHWFYALGQIQFYGHYYPSHARVIVLYDTPECPYVQCELDEAVAICKTHNVAVEILGSEWRNPGK